MPAKLPPKKLSDLHRKIVHKLRFYYQGHTNTGLVLLDRIRDFIAQISFSLASGHLKRLPKTSLETYVLNTCSLSPVLPSISHWADWSLHRQGFHGNLNITPGVVFVKADFDYIETFYKRYLPRIGSDSRFVLVTGDSDATIPLQVDKRFPGNAEHQLSLLRSLHDDPRILRWYAQNIDTAWPKFEPIPLGCWELDGTKLLRFALGQERLTSLYSRPLKAFCANRIRPGEQWELRRIVESRALNEWSKHVDYFHAVPPEEFFSVISGYPLVMCVGGGGLDPAPKAWTSLLAGSIPIIERNATTLAYQDLPVVFIDSWATFELSQETMLKWIGERERFFSDPHLRKQVLRQLSIGHWLQKIRHTVSAATSCQAR